MELDSENLMVVDFERETENDGFSSDEGEGANSMAHHLLLATHHSPQGVLIGRLATWDDAGNPLVDFPDNPSEGFLPAQTIVSLKPTDRGREVALLFINGNHQQPLIIGLLQHPKNQPAPSNPEPAVSAVVDGERLVFTAKQEIVLQCGEASLTLTKAGKVLIRGTYLLSRSSGVNRIKGGSVQIN